MAQLCFVLMPFGKKPGGDGRQIDFDAIYKELIAPAIERAGLEALRADGELTGGIIHKPMFERLLLCPVAIADLTTANANVFYELGVRHAVKPRTTTLIFADGHGQLPFDVRPLRGLPYKLDEKNQLADVENARAALAEQLDASRHGNTDSPVYQLVDDYPDLDRHIAHLKTDVFRDRADYARSMKDRLATARKAGIEAIHAIEAELGDLATCEAGVLVDLFLCYRSVKAWDAMVALAGKMPRPLADTVMIQEQLALALNRRGDGEQAKHVLREVLTKHGPSSETYGILGRVLKDRFDAARKEGRRPAAAGHLLQAIDAYRKGFEADWRDAYPGINAVTLMEIKEPPDPERKRLLPVVRYAVERKMASGEPDYWDHATMLELAVLAGDQALAEESLALALAAQREIWEPETTARNLRLIRDAREARGEQPGWASAVERALETAAKG